MRLALALIEEDGGTQSRAELVQEKIAEYAEHLAELPPVIVFYDGAKYWLADGFHRVSAAEEIGAADIEADVRQGTLRDAILFSFGVNATHGIPRSNADKRRAVERMLSDAEWGTWTQARIAETCRVSREFVSRVLGERQEAGKSTCDRSQVTGRDGRTYNTANLGRQQPAAATPASVPPPTFAPDRRLEALASVERAVDALKLAISDARAVPGVDILLAPQLEDLGSWLRGRRGFAA
jgi:hypothetical protein